MEEFKKGDIVKQKYTTVIDIYGEVVNPDSYQRNNMIVNFGKGNEKEVSKSRFELIFRR